MWPKLPADLFPEIGSDPKIHIELQRTKITYMQSTPCEMPGWMKHKLESRLLGEISITSITQITPPLWPKVKKN